MKQGFLTILAILMVFVGTTHRQFNVASSAPEGSLEDAHRVLRSIHPGMERSDVEALVQEPDEGPQSSTATRYIQGPGYLILVPYDENGGVWSDQNKVNGLPKITINRWRRSPSSKL